MIVSQSGLSLTFSFGEVPFRRFELRMQLDKNLQARFGASLYAEVYCPEVPVYGAALRVHRPLQRPEDPPGQRHVHHAPLPQGPPANHRPRGVSVARLDLRRPTPTAPGSAEATLRFAGGAAPRRAAHARHPAHRRGHRRAGVARLPQGAVHLGGPARKPHRRGPAHPAPARRCRRT